MEVERDMEMKAVQGSRGWRKRLKTVADTKDS